MCSVQLWTSCSSVAYDMAEGWRMVKNHAQLGGCWRSEQARHWHVAIDWYIISITSSCLVYSPSGGERPALEIWVQNSNAALSLLSSWKIPEVFQHNTFLTVEEEEDEEFSDLPFGRPVHGESRSWWRKWWLMTLCEGKTVGISMIFRKKNCFFL